MLSLFLLRRSSHRNILYRSSKSLYVGGGAWPAQSPKFTINHCQGLSDKGAESGSEGQIISFIEEMYKSEMVTDGPLRVL